MAAPGSPRPHWLPLLERLSGLGPEEWATRRDTVGRLLRERGVTYNVYTDAHGRDRPWELDLLPVIIPAAEWARRCIRAVEAIHRREIFLRRRR